MDNRETFVGSITELVTIWVTTTAVPSWNPNAGLVTSQVDRMLISPFPEFRSAKSSHVPTFSSFFRLLFLILLFFEIP